MAEILYPEELKKNLVKYKAVIDQIDDLTAVKNQMREQIKQWLALNGMTEYCTYDDNNQCWKISFNSSTRKGVSDWDELRGFLGSRYPDFIKNTESVSFIVKAIKHPS